MVAGPFAAGGLVDEGGEVLVPVQEVAVHAGTGDDHPPCNAPVFPTELGDRVEDGCSFGG